MTKLVYVIDDDQDMREVLSYALEADGYQVEAYENALKAFESLEHLSEKQLPSLILVDYLMPDMDGVSFVKLMKSSTDLLKKIPLVMSTAMGKKDFIQGFPDDVIHLSKPMDLDELLSVTRNFCS
jgi:two-component system alkaline phosphatase synthesis response regulator PhoP